MQDKEMRCCVKIYEFKIKTGKFESFVTATLHVDINTSAKQLFEESIQAHDDILNKFFVMEVESIIDDPFQDTNDFYTIRTNTRGTIDDISIVGPNNLDKEMLIDAIVGCKPTVEFLQNCNDRIVQKILTTSLEDNAEWSKDIKDRLQKVNVLRLKEIYQKLKS